MFDNSDFWVSIVQGIALHYTGDANIERYNNRFEVHADFPDTRSANVFLMELTDQFSNAEYTRDENFIIIWERV